MIVENKTTLVQHIFTYEQAHKHAHRHTDTHTSSLHTLTCQLEMALSTIHYFYVLPFT